MIDRGRKNVLGVLVDALDYEAAVDRVLEAARAHSPLAVTALAVHGVMTGVLDQEHRRRLNHLDLAVPDGQPVRWALNRIHRCGLDDRVYGPTLMLKVCEAAAEARIPVFLFGSTPDVLSDLGENLRRRLPSLDIAGSRASQFRRLAASESAALAHEIRSSSARIAFVGLGCPRQETWIYEQREAIGFPLVAVGAAFDFHAGRLPQAPSRMQRVGLEWLFRLISEPRRLWSRYLFLNPLYLALLSLQALHVRHFRIVTEPRPPARLHYG